MKAISASLVLAALCASAWAQQERVRSVDVVGIAGEELARAQRTLRVRPGDIYTPAAVQGDVAALLALPFVLSARASRTATPEGSDIVYEVASRGRLTGIEFAGNRKFRARKLREVGQIEEMEHYDLARLAQARDLILERYRQAGYIYARVEFASQPDGSVLFTIEEGRRMRVSRVTISGNEAIPDGILRRLMRTRTRRWVVLPARLDEDTVEEDRLRIQERYREAGYLDATTAVRLDLTRTGAGIHVEFVVTEGLLYTVRSVEVTGNELLSSEVLRAGLEMTEGRPFSMPRTIRDIAAIRSAYGRRGYIDATVAPTTLFAPDAPEVDVIYRVTDGSPVRIREVDIFGNEKTRDNVIRRDLEFVPGELFDTDKIEQSQRNLRRLDYFTQVDIATDERTAGQPERDVVVNVEEAPTGQFMIGVGINSNQGIVGNIAFIQRNYDYRALPVSWRDILEGRAWAGAGQYFELNASPGTELSQFRMNFRDPRVGDSDYSFKLGLHLWERAFQTYNERRLGGEVGVGRQITRDTFWEVEASVDEVNVRDIDDEVRALDVRDVLDVAGRNQVNTLGLTIGQDTRDSFLYPTSGRRLTAMVQASSNAIGSDFDFLRFRLDGSWHRTLGLDRIERPYVLSWRGRLGYLWPRNSEDAPIFERFFAGGAYDIRGFEYRGVGPRIGDTPVGGRFVALGGVQLEYPLAGDRLRGVFFWDTGTVVPDAGDFELRRVRHAVGFGFRFLIPAPVNFPMALDFAIPVRDLDEDETQTVSFSIGRTF